MEMTRNKHYNMQASNDHGQEDVIIITRWYADDDQ